MITYRDATKHITIEEAERLYEEHEIAVIINDGRHVTLTDELRPLAKAK